MNEHPTENTCDVPVDSTELGVQLHPKNLNNYVPAVESSDTTREERNNSSDGEQITQNYTVDLPNDLENQANISDMVGYVPNSENFSNQIRTSPINDGYLSQEVSSRTRTFDVVSQNMEDFGMDVDPLIEDDNKMDVEPPPIEDDDKMDVDPPPIEILAPRLVIKFNIELRFEMS